MFNTQSLDQGLIERAFPSGRHDFLALVRSGAIGAAAIASIVLVGWSFGIEPMKRIVAGLTSMNPMTAICMLLAALCLWLLQTGRAPGFRGVLANLLPWPLIYVGASKLVDLRFGTGFCPDDILFADQLDYGQPFPSRMAPNVALCFILLAIALISFDRPRWPKALSAQWLAAVVLAIAFSALIGYAYDSSGFYKFKQYIPMALHSAACFLLLGTGVLFSRPQQGFMRLLPRGSPGARMYWSMLPACVLIPALLGGLALIGTDHGWFSGKGTGTAIVAVLTIFVLAGLAFANSVALNGTESMRKLSGLQTQRLLAELDSRNEALIKEVAERKRMEALATQQASRDPLTGLPNRLLFNEHLRKALGRCQRFDQQIALIYIDIDHFKPINDRYGHAVGDVVLQQIAKRLLNALREVDTVARLGGDEFAVIMDSPINLEHARSLAGRIAACLVSPMELLRPAGNIRLEVGASLGMAIYPEHGVNVEHLLHAADEAMFAAKRDGKLHKTAMNIAVAAPAHGDESPAPGPGFA